MTFRFVLDQPDGFASLTARAVHATTDHPKPAVAIRISSPASRVLYVPLDRIEELVTGIRDIARQATK
ncbi:hypothetical protein [Streptomyces rubiginosohelvolus]|uniref:hypothetical protein n=1 Tax=Streptomyces rubiginosohelvolus TaxID=67362 RepID=UPI0036E37DFF